MKPFAAALLIISLAFGWAPAALALDPTLKISQYKHTRWTMDEGAPRHITAFTQDRAGFLWIGSAAGLFRFDGLSFEPITVPGEREARGVSALTTSSSGEVWVGYGEGGTAVYRRGALVDVPMNDPTYVMNLAETPDRSLWALLGRGQHQLMRLRDGRWSDLGGSLGFPAENCIQLMVSRDGSVWAATITSLLRLRSGAARFERIGVALKGHASLAEDAAGRVWMSDAAGSRVVSADPAGRPPKRYATPTATRKVMTLFDRRGALWGMEDNGLFRVAAPKPSGPASSKEAAEVEHYDGAASGGSHNVNAFFEDREGDLWIGAPTGLERFRDLSVVAVPPLTKNAFWGDALLRARDGTVYVGEADAVYRVRPGAAPERILQAEAQSLCEGPDGAIWMVLENRIVRLNGERQTSTPGMPGAERTVTGCLVDAQNRLWLAGNDAGLLQGSGGRWSVITPPGFKGKLEPSALSTDGAGRLLVMTGSRLVALNATGGVSTLITGKEGLGRLRTLYAGSDAIWVGARRGLARLKGGGLSLISTTTVPQLRNTAGIAQTVSGDFWLSTSMGIVGIVSAGLEAALAKPGTAPPIRLFDYRDGVGGTQSRDTTRALVQGGDGRLWTINDTGAQLIDPSRLPANAVAPTPVISALKVGDTVYRDPAVVKLNAGASKLEIDFAAPSLRVPERVRVLYRLVGVDRGWVDPGKRRQAFYTGLKPGRFEFRVIAANDDGVWNRAGTKLPIELPPTFLQSNLFKGLIGAAVLVALCCAYLLRVSHLTRRIRARLEERLAERERIARDLHDTLLQGFQGLILRFQSVANEIPRGQRARRLIDEALESADEVLNDGRDSVSHLRALQHANVADAFAEAAKRLQREHPLAFRMTVEGTPRRLHPVVREEITRIGCEALTNAFRHSHGSNVELSLSYRPSALVLGVRDDGRGIDAGVLAQGGRAGHFGLMGMRERAAQIDAELQVSLQPGGGAEVQVVAPGAVAYAQAPRVGRWPWPRLALPQEV